MFQNKKAWFSRSVGRHVCDVWVSEGGIITNCTAAEYLFSNDASHPDTQRLFRSMDYFEDRLTVFHSSYISACEKSRTKGAVAIGHYVLPPDCVQEEVKAAVGCFIWEKEDHNGTKEAESVRRTQTRVQTDEECHRLNPGHLKIDKRKSRQEVFGRKKAPRDGALCCFVQHYPVNNMVTGYVSSSELKKYSGALHSFTPGHAGYSVCRAV